ncbi:MAG: DUF4387 domain-containing protein [Promethearchaeota archaeon]
MIKRTLLTELATVIRSKNAGPFKITLDIFFNNEENYLKVKGSGAITRETIAKLYKIHENRILGIYFVDKVHGIKITILRGPSSGSATDTDVYGAQQHAPLLALEIPLIN